MYFTICPRTSKLVVVVLRKRAATIKSKQNNDHSSQDLVRNNSFCLKQIYEYNFFFLIHGCKSLVALFDNQNRKERMKVIIMIFVFLKTYKKENIYLINHHKLESYNNECKYHPSYNVLVWNKSILSQVHFL